jgi:hypothetical protein
VLTAVRGPDAPVRGAVRLARVGVLGGGSLLLATLAHMTGGGELPAAWVLTVTGVLLGVVAVTLTARRCRFGLLLAALTVQQLLLHLLFDSASRVVPGCHALTMPTGHAVHGVVQTCAMTTAMDPVLPGWTMWAGHVLATVLTAALLARGETWLWRAADRVVAVATAAPGARPARRLARVTSVRPSVRPTRRARGAASPRGPPLRCAGC